MRTGSIFRLPRAAAASPRQSGCPETPSIVRVTVTGTGDTNPCSMQYMTLIGYIQLDSIGDREITGNGS